MTAIPLLGILLPIGCSPKGAGVDCSDFVGAVMTAEQVSATPRADPLAEGTVLCMAGGAVVAKEKLYARVASDFETILDTIDEYERTRGFMSDLASFSWSDQFPQELTLKVDDDALSQLRTGDYHDWDCLNRWYEMTTPADYPDAYVTLTFDGVYDPRYLIDEYAALSGVSEVYVHEDDDEDGYHSGMRALVVGDTVWYAYNATGGDCPEGCTDYLGLYFVSSAAGEVELAGERVENDSERTNTTPDWGDDLPLCAG